MTASHRRLGRSKHACSGSSRRPQQAPWLLALLLMLAASASRVAAVKWEPGYLLTNFIDGSGKDFMRVLDSAGTLVEDVAVSGGDAWAKDDHVGWAVAAYNGARVFFVTTESMSIYSVGVEVPHKVSYVATLPKDIKGVEVTTAHSLAVDPKGRLYAGVAVGCLENSPQDCIGSYVVRYTLEEEGAKLRAVKVDAFPFVTHNLAMSQDGSILYGLDDPTQNGGAKAIRQLNLTTMVPLPAFVVRQGSSCSALAAGGPQGPIVACHGGQHPIDTKPAAVPVGTKERSVHSSVSDPVATATRLATNTQVNATYVWAYSPAGDNSPATLTKVNTSTGLAISPALTLNVPTELLAMTVVPGGEPESASQPVTTARSLRRQLRGLRAFATTQRSHIHKLWE